MLTEQAFRKEPGLSRFVFDRLLAWLDDGAESHGERYLEMHRRLVSYFDRRNRPAAEELADETLNRVARKLEQCGDIATRPPARYCYVVARFVLLEDLRRERRQVGLDQTRPFTDFRAGRADPHEDVAGRERRLDCLDRCLRQLDPEQRALIVDYYRDSRQQKIERRRELANQLGVSMNAVAIRAFRIRDRLMKCLSGCPTATAKDIGPLGAVATER